METFAALSDPTRRQIIELLGPGPLPAGSIAERFALSAPAVSQHLKVLREAGLVTQQVDAQRRIYALNPAGFAAMDQWLAQVRRFWGPKLDALEAELTKDDTP
ncbi:ArsR/SmtB family transcription factor [Ferrovibrio sp.]|uniref:ArsR/SmtB family transcription factor n=1 Tax=Ferrovibrio sp. TaxID=1917215 RepID=UPI003D28078A